MNDPTQAEIDRIANHHLRVRRRADESSGPHVYADCLLCGGRGKLNLNTDNGLWDCKVCQQTGNLWTLANHLGVRIRERSLVKGPAGYLLDASRSTLKTRVRSAKGVTRDSVKKASDRIWEDEKGKQVGDYLRGRGLEDDTIRHFQLTVTHINGEVAVGIPYLQGDRVPLVKMRNLKSGPEREFARTKGAQSPLFNIDAIRDCAQVILVEGEFDAISLWQMGFSNVASTSTGAKKRLPVEWVEALANAQDIVLWYDNDESGEDARDGLITQLGTHRCRIAETDLLPRGVKDANDLLKALGDEASGVADQVIGKAKRVENAAWSRPQLFTETISSEINQGSETLGVPTGWDGLDRLIKGWRPGELTVINGHTNHGKTSFAVAVLENLLKQGLPVGAGAFERGPLTVARKLFQRRYGKPISSISSEEERIQAQEVLGAFGETPFWILGLKGPQQIDDIIDAMRYVVHSYGVRYIALDHLNYFTRRPAGVTESQVSDRALIDDAMMRLVDETETLGIHTFLVTHVKGTIPKNVIPEGGACKGSSSPQQDATNGISVYRQVGAKTRSQRKLMTSAEQRIEAELGPSDALIHVWKAKHEVSTEGHCVLQFDSQCLEYRDPPEIDPFETRDVEQDDLFDEPI